MAYRSGLVVGISMAFVSLVLVAVAACSSSSSDPTAAPAPTGEGGVVVNTDLCKSTSNYEECKACCNPPTGYLTAQQTFDTCMCQGACAAPCADSVCVTDPDASANPQSAACTTCLDSDPSAAGCSAQAATVCNNDMNCTRFTQCVNTACAALPNVDAGH